MLFIKPECLEAKNPESKNPENKNPESNRENNFILEIE
jgi:hypothetical protein